MPWNMDALENGALASKTPSGCHSTLLSLAVVPATVPFHGQPSGPFREGTRQFSAATLTAALSLDGVWEAFQLGYVSGVQMVTPYEADLFHFREEQKAYNADSGSDASELSYALSQSTMPVLDPNSKQDPVVVFVADEGVQLTASGWAEAAKLVEGQYHGLPAAMRHVVDPLLAAADFGGALRAAWKLIEQALLSQIGAQGSGDALVTKYIAWLMAASAERPGGPMPEAARAFLTELRDELQSLCGYVSSENSGLLERAQATDCKALLLRYGRAYESVASAARAVR